MNVISRKPLNETRSLSCRPHAPEREETNLKYTTSCDAVKAIVRNAHRAAPSVVRLNLLPEPPNADIG